MSERHEFHPSILRAYDIRGIVGDTLTEQDAYFVGRSLASVVAERGGQTVAVGWDGRLHSPGLADAVCTGAADAGMDVKRVGRGPTPMLYFAAHHLHADGGIMVTGSHNPPSHNGFKLMLGDRTLSGEQIRDLGTRAASGGLASGTGSVQDVEILPTYVDRLLEGLRLSGSQKCAWDPGHGAAAEVMNALLDRMPGEHVTINAHIDGTFPGHHPDPSEEENLEQLRELVLENGCDIGLAFDGDGDRLGLVDGKGRIVWPDQALVLLARHLLAKRPGATVIADVKASQVLFDEVERAGGKAEMWRTGHSLIKGRMRETGAPLAGEMSGHIFFADDWYGFDDGLYAALRVLAALDWAEISLADVLDGLPRTLTTPELRFECDEERKFDCVEAVRREVGKSAAEVIDIDGVRVIDDGGWWLLRASNTQAVLVARCEGKSADDLQRQKLALSHALDAAGVDSSSLNLREVA
ncbi:MAG: phosphomannomutase/phosphoglucomutase [Acetobacterales bacterium]